MPWFLCVLSIWVTAVSSDPQSVRTDSVVSPYGWEFDVRIRLIDTPLLPFSVSSIQHVLHHYILGVFSKMATEKKHSRWLVASKSRGYCINQEIEETKDKRFKLFFLGKVNCGLFTCWRHDMGHSFMQTTIPVIWYYC